MKKIILGFVLFSMLILSSCNNITTNNDSNTKASTTELEVSTNTNSNDAEIINGDTTSENTENVTPNKDEDDIKQTSDGDSSPNDGQWSEPLFF